MADIYSRSVSYGGAFSADGAVITFGGNLGVGMLAQSINWSYVQNVQRIYEVGSTAVYLVAGRTQGQASINRIMSPSAIATPFYSSFGNVCNASGNNITFSPAASCGGLRGNNLGTANNITLYSCVIQSYGGGIQAEQMVVNEQVQMLFIYMTYA